MLIRSWSLENYRIWLKKKIGSIETTIARALGGLPVESMHCAHLPMEAFRNAKKNYEHSIRKERKEH